MPTLNGSLQEYERHFSGIWGHFPECCIFCLKSTKCTHKFLVRQASISPNTVPLPPSQMHHAGSFTSISCIFSSPQLASDSKGQRFVYSDEFPHPHRVFCQGIHFALYHRRVLGLATFLPPKVMFSNKLCTNQSVFYFTTGDQVSPV